MLGAIDICGVERANDADGIVVDFSSSSSSSSSSLLLQDSERLASSSTASLSSISTSVSLPQDAGDLSKKGLVGAASFVLKPGQNVQRLIGGGWTAACSMSKITFADGTSFSPVQCSLFWLQSKSSLITSLVVVKGFAPHFDYTADCKQVHPSFSMRVCAVGGPSSGEAYVALLTSPTTMVDLTGITAGTGSEGRMSVAIYPHKGTIFYTFQVILKIAVDPETGGHLVRLTWGLGVIQYAPKVNVPSLFRPQTIKTLA